MRGDDAGNKAGDDITGDGGGDLGEHTGESGEDLVLLGSVGGTRLGLVGLKICIRFGNLLDPAIINFCGIGEQQYCLIF